MTEPSSASLTSDSSIREAMSSLMPDSAVVLTCELNGTEGDISVSLLMLEEVCVHSKGPMSLRGVSRSRAGGLSSCGLIVADIR